MFLITVKRILRNKWVLTKMFVVSPLFQILPLILMSSNYIKVDQKMVYCLCLWSFFYFSCFESTNMRMEVFNSEKINDILMSKYNLLLVISIDNIYIAICFLPSLFFAFSFFNLIYGVVFNVFDIFVGIILMIILNQLTMQLCLAMQLKNNDYFQKFNLLMNIAYILSCVTYEASNLFFPLNVLSIIIPSTFIFEFFRTKKIIFIIYFLIESTIYSLILYILLHKQINRFKEG